MTFLVLVKNYLRIFQRARAMSQGNRVVMVGAFPPPMHGMAAVNSAVHDRLRAHHVDVVVLDTAGRSLDRSLRERFSRFPRVVSALLQLCVLSSPGHLSLYISVSGGLGQIYEVLYLAVARLRRMRIHLHHHSYAYLDQRSLLASILFKAAGKRAIHIVLSQGMSVRLRTHYPVVREVLVVSNAGLLLAGCEAFSVPRQRLLTIGLISNLTEEKGVFDFLRLCAEIQAARMPVRAHLAGPFQDSGIEQAVLKEIGNLQNVVDYLGPLYGVEKEKFYSAIDVLVFPTRYKNEAEPLTIHEAMRCGATIVAYGRGAIPELLDHSMGLSINPRSDFVRPAYELLSSWIDSEETFSAASAAAIERSSRIRSEAANGVELLLKSLQDS